MTDWRDALAKAWSQGENWYRQVVLGQEPLPWYPRMTTFDVKTQCCFCGADNRAEPRGYAGERTCCVCGHGGDGEPDAEVMFYKSVAATPTGEETT